MKTIRITCALIAALAVTFNVKSQSWVWANDLNNDFDNNFYSFMDVDGLGNSYYLYRYDETGYYGDEEVEFLDGEDSTPYFLAKHAPSGELLWTKKIDGESQTVNGFLMTNMEVSSNGEIYINGTATIFVFGGMGTPFGIDGVVLSLPQALSSQGFLYKLDTDGVAMWGVEINEGSIPAFGSSQGAFRSSLSADESSLYIAGPHSKDSLFFNGSGIKISEAENPFTVATFFVGKVSTADGSLQWAYGGHGGEEYNGIYGIETNASDEIYVNVSWAGDTCVVGDFEIPNPDNQGLLSADNLIAKFSNEGEPVWVSNLASPSIDYSDFALNGDGDIVVFGDIFEGIDIGGNDLEAPGSYVAKYNFEGTLSSVQKVSNASAKKVIADGMGNFFIAGEFSDEALSMGDFEIENAGGALGTSDIVIANISETGEVFDVMQVGGMDGETVQLIDLTAQNQIIVSGTYGSLSLELDDIELENELFPGVKGFVAGLDYPLSLLDHTKSTVSLQMYPNPASDFIAFDFPDQVMGSVQLSLMDINGRKVLQENRVIGTTNRLDISQIANGLYYLSFDSDDQRYVGKVMINR